MTAKMPRRLFATAILSLVVACGCKTADRNPESGQIVWFVQLTDPHLFLGALKDPKDPIEPTQLKQEDLDRRTLEQALQAIPFLAHGDRSFPFLVITGDFGVDPCPNSDSPSGQAAKDCVGKIKDADQARISTLAKVLGASPIREIYLVPGNNDIPNETADDSGLAYFDKFMKAVGDQIKASGSNVVLHNLNHCYLKTDEPESCYFDVPNTQYRLIGFPSYSFKNKGPAAAPNPPLQEKQFETFQALLKDAKQDGKKIVILTHIPFIDDPFTMGQDLYTSKAPLPAVAGADPARSKWSAWNVSKKVADDWQQAIADPSVIAVLAGHLHDSHKEIYQRPFPWSTVNDPKNGFAKLYLAPPLSVKLQDGSPIQARGLALVGLDAGQVDYRIYWYNAADGSFAASPESASEGHKPRAPRRHWLQLARGAIAWLWGLAGDPQGSLDHMAVLLIAFVAAFLTVVQIWQLPPPDNPLLAPKPPPAAPAPNPAPGTPAAAAPPGGGKPAFDPSPFASNFGKTVVTGLGGLAAAVVLKSIDGTSGSNTSDNKFYIVWFVLFFFAILIVGAGLRGIGEALRERFIIDHPKPDPPQFRNHHKAQPERFFSWAGLWTVYWLSRFWDWLLSMRFSALTFLDTFINLIQGKNQTLTRVFSDTIVKQQRNVVSVAQVLRQQLNDYILEYLNANFPLEGNGPSQRSARDVRVNISVLSEDKTTVFYIARTPGSSAKVFPKHSIAWVSAFTGNIRWYKDAYFDHKDIVLFDNASGLIPGGEDKLKLSSYLQQREADYQAFVLFPVPWPKRAYGDNSVRGAIHISFHRQKDFNEVWKHYPEHDPVTTGEKKNEYSSEENMLGKWCDPQIAASLNQSIGILSQLLSGFNEDIYKNSMNRDDCS